MTNVIGRSGVRSICIVGGGSAGWMTAAYALANLPNTKIYLIESPNVPIVGVGEATILGFDTFMEDCDIPFELWTKSCGSTIKCGTFFPNWRDDGLDIWQPFFFPLVASSKGPLDVVNLGIEADLDKETFFKTSQNWYDSCVTNQKIPSSCKPAGGQHSVGYHLDAVRLANFLSEYLRNKHPKLVHIQDHVSNVNSQHESIVSVDLESGETVSADFFIDCTGFKRLLSSALPDAEWVDRSNQLFTNAAVASQINYVTDDEDQTPYVTAQAVDLGWIWKTPVKERIGSGLCYNSDITSKQEAEDFFVQHWGEDRLRTGQFNHIPFKPEYNANNWRSNCFSVGLASGFIEPLESTGLALLINGIWGLRCFEKGNYTEQDRLEYNSNMKQVYEDSMNFVALHYFNNPRKGKFWEHVDKNFDATDSLYDLLKGYKQQPSTGIDEQFFPRNTELFTEMNWKLWMHTVGIKPALHGLDKDEASKLLEQMIKDDKQNSSPGIKNRAWGNR
tara:strand:- start:7054 stop:8562 length:1509 start_codon:yes stop_codon:yes gene_type:complete